MRAAALTKARPLAVVIDDDPLAAEAMSITVSDWGADVITASGIDDARRQLGAGAASVAWIITDFDLGVGMNGVDAVQELKKSARSARVLVISGGVIEFAERAHAAGFDTLRKPASAEQIHAWLEGL